MPGEIVHKGNDRTAALDKAATGIHIGDVGELVIRNIKQPCQFRSVGGGLVQHDQKLTVGQHGPGGVRLEQVIHILCDACAAGSVLPYPFPEGEQEVGAVLKLWPIWVTI